MLLIQIKIDEKCYWEKKEYEYIGIE